MSLIFDSHPLVVNPDLAVEIGLHEAIILQQLHYWTEKNNSGIRVDGTVWIYNTYEQWRIQFPFLSQSTIKRCLSRLKQIDLINVKQLNKHKHDRTNFYSINYESVKRLSMRCSNRSICTHRQDQVNPISTETTTETTTEICAPHGECAPETVIAEQLPAKPKLAPKKLAAKELDYSGWPAHPAPQILADWLASRKNLRAAVTQTVINRMATELHKAAQAGYTVDDCLSLACERGWRGIKAEWVINANSSNQNLGVNHANGRTNHERRSEVDAAINNWQDTSWAHDLIHGDNPEHY